MSRYSGPQYKGAAREAQQLKRAEAEQRNARTTLDRTRRFRRAALKAAGL